MRGPWTGNPETLQDSLFYPWFSVCGGLSDSSSYQIVNFLQLAASAFDSNRFCTACWIPVRLTLLPARCVADSGTTCRSYKDSYSCAHPKLKHICAAICRIQTATCSGARWWRQYEEEIGEPHSTKTCSAQPYRNRAPSPKHKHETLNLLIETANPIPSTP